MYRDQTWVNKYPRFEIGWDLVTYIPQQNGLAEDEPHNCGARQSYVVLLANGQNIVGRIRDVYITNRIPNTARSGASPYEVLWQGKAHKFMLLGYTENSKLYRVWDLDLARVVTARTIAVDERTPSTVQTIAVHDDLPIATVLDDDNFDEAINVQKPSAPVGPSSSADVDMHRDDVM
ncbi:hypothetical protein ON010_g11952 [Phytophthora cinnamomi]|nr:hypothetical protein ON010_g11952 [Phytophthora cinnamomi]